MESALGVAKLLRFLYVLGPDSNAGSQ